jgi:putative ABC transport system permease protein
MSKRGRSFAEWLFDTTLALYPGEFRERFADEMRAFVRERETEARYLGVTGRSRLALHLVVDTLRMAPAARFDAWRAQHHRHAAERERRARERRLQQGERMDLLLQDLRYGLRSLRKWPGFAFVAVSTLALGIGANTAIFSVVNAALLRPLPWPDPDRLVVVWGTRGANQQNGVAYLDYLDWKRQTTSFEDLGVVRGQSVNLTGGDTPERLFGTFATASTFRLLNASVASGRLFTEAETEVATKQPVAVLSDGLWRRRFGARPDVVGSTLVLNGQTFTVVGILRPGFEAPLGTPDVWMPIGYYPNKGDLELRGRGGVWVFGRLKPDASLARAQSELDAVTKRLEQLYPNTNQGLGANVQDLKDQIVGPARAPLLLLLSAVGVVLLIACANVANLQLARAASRRRELSVRAALGAGRARLLRQLLTESLVLSILGGALGIGIAYAGVRWLATKLQANAPDMIPGTFYGPIAIEKPVLLFAIAATTLAGVLFGLLPAWQASRADLHDSLSVRAEGASGVRLGVRRGLVVGQIALCMMLLVSAGLLTRSLMALAQVKPGFDTDRLLTLQFRLPAAKYDTEAKIAEMFTRTIAEIRAVPGVQSAALVRATPLGGNGESFPYAVDGRPEPTGKDATTLQANIVSPGYFETMKISRLSGRDFTMNDRDGAARVVIVNEQLATRVWPGTSALGKQIRIGGPDEPWATVVGVVGTVKHFQLTEHAIDQAYFPYLQRPLIFTEVVVRATGDPANVANGVRAAIWRVDRDQPVWGIRVMDRVLERALGQPKFTMWLTSSFAFVALLLAMLGVYGVISYSVAQRTHEVGLRIALGAQGGQVVRMIVAEGSRLVGVAIVIGIVAALGATRLIRTQLFGITPSDPLTFGLVTLVLAVVAIVACYLPARRASRVDPMVALRVE